MRLCRSPATSSRPEGAHGISMCRSARRPVGQPPPSERAFAAKDWGDSSRVRGQVDVSWVSLPEWTLQGESGLSAGWERPLCATRPMQRKRQIPGNGRDRNHPARTVPVENSQPLVGPDLGVCPMHGGAWKCQGQADNSAARTTGSQTMAGAAPMGILWCEEDYIDSERVANPPCLRGRSRCKCPVSSVTESCPRRARRRGLRGYAAGCRRILMFHSVSAPGDAEPNPPGCRSTIRRGPIGKWSSCLLRSLQPGIRIRSLGRPSQGARQSHGRSARLVLTDCETDQLEPGRAMDAPRRFSVHTCPLSRCGRETLASRQGGGCPSSTSGNLAHDLFGL